jgi:hypothetical protein
MSGLRESSRRRDPFVWKLRFASRGIILIVQEGRTKHTFLGERDMAQTELERRVEELERRERRSRSLPYTVLALMLGVLGAVLIQYKINAYFKERIKPVYRIEVSDAK